MENLKKIREARNLNQLKVAMDVGLTQEAISKYETGNATPSCQVLILLAEYFNCSTDYLLDRTDSVKMNTTKASKDDEILENLIFRYKKLSKENQKKLEGCLLALEQK
jgi:transcriptional regulator with XRE-family HTH domain